MNSFKKKEKNVRLPMGAVWLLNSISEYKGKQELYEKQSPQLLKKLVEMALIESSESSNRIEGVTVERKRLKPLIIGRSAPRDRSEEEVAGYRRALDFIHKKYKSIEILPETIKKLHSLSHGAAGDAGKWKTIDNEIIKKNRDGSVEVIFRPVSPKQTPKAIDQLCLSYKNSISQLKYPDLYAIACLILDFLCIHPFRDGNGRVSRLLTLLALYQHSYDVGRYISLERIIEQSKETYYEVLNKSSQKWHESGHNIEPWLNYFLGTIKVAYKELEQRAERAKPVRGSKTQLVIEAIESQEGEFSIRDIEQMCSSISRDMIKIIFRSLKKEKKIKSLGKGQSAKWIKVQ